MALEATQLAKLLKLRAVGWSQQEIADWDFAASSGLSAEEIEGRIDEEGS